MLGKCPILKEFSRRRQTVSTWTRNATASKVGWLESKALEHPDLGLTSTHLLDSGKMRVLPVVSLRGHWPCQFLAVSQGRNSTCGCLSTSNSGCCHHGEAPIGLHNIWATQAGRAPLCSRAQAQARWGVGWGWGLRNSGAQPDTPEQSRASPDATPPECLQCLAHFIPGPPPSTLPKNNC